MQQGGDLEDKMDRAHSLMDCFSHLSVVPRRGETSWSARNDETGVVAIVAHKTWFHETLGVMVYDQGPLWDGWQSTPAAADLVEDLCWARKNVSGRVRVILALGSNDYRDLSSRDPFEPGSMTVYIDDVNEASGSFRLIVR